MGIEIEYPLGCVNSRIHYLVTPAVVKLLIQWRMSPNIFTNLI